MQKTIIRLNTILISLWGVFVVLSGTFFIPDNLLTMIYRAKYIVPGFLLLILLFFGVQKGKIRFNFLVGILFPLYALISLMLYSSFSYELVLVYLTWMLLIFYASYYFYKYVKRDAITCFYLTLVSLEIFVIVLGLVKQRILWFDGSLVFSIRNPNFFGDITATGGILSIYFLYKKRKKIFKIMNFVVLVSNLLLTIGSHSTSSIVLLLTVVILLWIHGLNSWNRLSVIFLFFCLVILFVYSLVNESYAYINQLSTGRLQIWVLNFKENLTNPIQWLFGNASMIVVGYPNANFDDFVKIKHIDNTYLEILIRYGLFGFLLFISPLIQNLKKFKILIFHRNCSYEIRFAKSVIFAILVQGLYETNMPSLGNLMNIMLFFSFGLLNDPTNSRKLVKSSQIL